jgi:hypothetical protein
MKQQGLLACIKQRRDEDTELKEGGGVDGCTLILRVPLSHDSSFVRTMYRVGK